MKWAIGFGVFVIMLVIAAQIARRSQKFSDWSGLKYVPTAA